MKLLCKKSQNPWNYIYVFVQKSTFSTKKSIFSVPRSHPKSLYFWLPSWRILKDFEHLTDTFGDHLSKNYRKELTITPPKSSPQDWTANRNIHTSVAGWLSSLTPPRRRTQTYSETNASMNSWATSHSYSPAGFRHEHTHLNRRVAQNNQFQEQEQVA